MSNSTGQPGSGGAQHSQSTSEAARDTKDELVGAAKDKAGELKEDVKAAGEQARDHLRSAATEQKDAAAGRMGGFAHALRTASNDLHEQGQDFAAEYVREAAGGLERASSALQGRNLDQLVEGVEDFARRQPVAFLGGAVIAGFGLARLMKSSAERRRSGAPGQGPAAPSAATPGGAATSPRGFGGATSPGGVSGDVR